MTGRVRGMNLVLAAVLFTCCSAVFGPEDEECDVFGEGACDSGFSLLQRRTTLASADGAVARVTIAAADASDSDVSDADVSDGDSKGGAEGTEGGDAAKHGAERGSAAQSKHHRPKPEWNEALLQRSSRTSALSSLEKTVSSKLFGGDSTATQAIHGAEQLAKTVGNSSSGGMRRNTPSRRWRAQDGNCTVPSKHDSFERYLGCLSDHCEDGAAELSGGVSCSVMVSSGCGTDLHSLHDAVPAGIFVGRVCAQSCGWCGDDPRALAAKAAAGAAALMEAKGPRPGAAETMEAGGAAETLIATGAKWGMAETLIATGANGSEVAEALS